MKRIVVTISLLAVSAKAVFGQGRVLFNNVISGNAVTVYAINQGGVSGGAAGANVGANYSIQLLWAPQGFYASPGSFYAAVMGSSAPFAFFGTTGGSPATDGAGLFDGGIAPNPAGTSMPAGHYTMMARAWFNTGFATYNLAFAADRNTGYVMFNQTATTISPAPNTIFPSFQVGLDVPTPEPSTFAIAGAGAVCLLLFRRR